MQLSFSSIPALQKNGVRTNETYRAHVSVYCPNTHAQRRRTLLFLGKDEAACFHDLESYIPRILIGIDRIH